MRSTARLCVFLVSCIAILLATARPAPACDASVELLITEFMALNDETIQDEDAAYSDWIEIYNPCLTSVDVGGWYLTDDSANLTKWQFPSVSLGRGEFLVVFASGKNRAVAGSELHTNFQLASAGDYLALVEPDGTTVAQEFAPTFPQQLTDVSYGLPQTHLELATLGDATTYHVPTLDDSGVGSAWAGPGWDDSTWESGSTGLGYTTFGTDGFDVTFFKANITVGSLATAEGVIADPITQSYTASETAQVINYLNTGGSARFDNDAPYPSTTIGSDVDDFVLLATATVQIPSAGPWSFGVNSDDGFGLELTREPHTFQMSYPGIRGSNDSISVFNVPEPGAYSVRLVAFERSGGSQVEMFAAEGIHSFFNGNFKLIGDTANGGLPLGAIGAQIGTDVQSVMQGVNCSIWSRVEFDLADPSPLSLMTLKAGYEDGFVAYLNGTEVASKNAPSPVYWDSASLTDRPVEDASSFETIDLTDQMHLLVSGTNVLALHGLNETVSDQDFLILGQLGAPEDTVDVGSGNFFVAPTPGNYNNGGYPAVSDIAFFSHPSGSFTDPFQLTILTVNQDAVIRYTTDGSEPTETNGTEYVAPVSIDTSTKIRARVFEPGKAPSSVETRLYTMLASDITDFDSDLPIVIVDSFGSGVSSFFFTDILFSIIPKDGARASILDPAQFEGLAGLKLRGSSSASFPKKMYALEIRDQNFQDLHVELLDMPAQSDWILYAPYSDKSLMRNVLAYQWSNAIGRYAVRTHFVEVYLQLGSGPVDSSDYAGVYVLMEKIKRDPNRVPITQLEAHHNAEPEITGGYILKKDRLDPDDSGFVINSGHRLAYVDPKEVEITATQAQWIVDYLNDFEAALDGPDFADPVLGYEPYIDVLSFIDHHILVEVTKNIDGYRLSTFMFKDRGGKLTMGPIWDYNLSLGNANYLQGWLPQGWYYPLIAGHNYPWYPRLFQDPAFELQYADRWYELRRDEFRTEKMLADVDGWAAVLDESQERNFTRWPVLGTYVWPNWFIADTWEEEIDWMKGWLEDRLEWMDSQFFEPPEFNHPAGEIPLGWLLTMTSPLGTIYYTTDGTDPMLPDESINPSAVEYTAALQMTVPIQIKARALDGSTWSAINGGFFYPQPLAFINEVLPDNQTVHTDEQGDYDAWIELYNPFSSVVDLSGLYLTDDVGVPDKWTIPAGTTLCPHLWLLIWADNETGEGPYHTSFTLNPAGGTLYLFDQTGLLLDSLTYPALLPDESYGRQPDGGAELGPFSYPTPDTANPGVGAPIIVNEYNAVAPTELLDNGRSDFFWGRVPGNGGEWFELVVVQDHLDIRDWSVTVEDNGGAVSTTLDFTRKPVLADLRSGTILTVSTNLASNVSYDPADGDWWINLRAGLSGDGQYISDLDFTLSNQQSRITIRDDLGAVVFGPAGEGINPVDGIGNDEVFKLEEDPGPNVTPYSNYVGGSSSTFGAPNLWNSGANEQDFVVLRSVVQANCTLDLQCDDGNPCTDDACTAGTCENLANTATCDDENPCTQNDVCADTQCRGDIVESCCVSDCECADGDACTSDECINNVCVNDLAPTGTPCEDGDLCTVGDSCDLGVCIGGGPPDCTALDDDCNVGVCNPADGSCMTAATNEGGACDDGGLCTMGDTCAAGVCGLPMDCSHLDETCNVGVCDPVTGSCYPQPSNEGGACDDGDLCTQSDACAGGACEGQAVDCSGFDDQCSVGVCNPGDGSCGAQDTNEGLDCSDGDSCTLGDVCTSGVCVGVPIDCNDSNDCTSDNCVAGTCEYTASGVCNLSGSVTYYRDFVAESEPSTKPVPDVEIDLDGDALSDAVTDATGSYAVPDLAGSFVIAPLPNYGDGEPADANGAVSPFDATFIAEYLVGLEELSVNQQAAADTSGDGTLSSLDSALAAQLSVGLLQHLPIADAEGSDWLYLRCDNYLAGNNHDCTEPLYVFDPLTQAEVTYFHAILYGDVTGNWSPPGPVLLPIVPGDTWRYIGGSTEPPPNWTSIGFDDSQWTASPSGFGYGSDCSAGHATRLVGMQGNYPSVYMRIAFTVGNPAEIDALTLTVDYDDAFVAYLNGQEVARSNVVGNPPSSTQLATANHECSTGSPANPAEDFTVSTTPLVAGVNVLAIQGHNLTLGSSDFTLIPTLTGTIASSDVGDGDWDVPLTPEQAAARVDLRRGAQLRAAGAHEVRRQRVRATPATLTLEGWNGPLKPGMGRELLLELTEADGIEALDLVLGYDPAQVSIVSVTAVGLGEQLTLVSNHDGQAYRIAMYGILPLEGSGKLLSVMIEARSALGHLSPIEIEGAANEGGVPLRIQVPHPGTSKERLDSSPGRASRRR